jgi:5-methylcytosine-specific restriction endonuclease McrA
MYVVKQHIRDRDDNKCVECGAKRQPGKPQLDVHRIVPGSEYFPDECVTLCRDCHKTKPKQEGLNIYDVRRARKRELANVK